MCHSDGQLAAIGLIHAHIYSVNSHSAKGEEERKREGGSRGQRRTLEGRGEKGRTEVIGIFC